MTIYSGVDYFVLENDPQFGWSFLSSCSLFGRVDWFLSPLLPCSKILGHNIIPCRCFMVPHCTKATTLVALNTWKFSAVSRILVKHNECMHKWYIYQENEEICLKFVWIYIYIYILEIFFIQISSSLWRRTNHTK